MPKHMYGSAQLYIDDLSRDQVAALEERMRPGEFSGVGFLGTHESLREVIERDSATLRERGVTHDQIADRLEYFIGRYERLHELARREDISHGRYRNTAIDTLPGGVKLELRGYFGSQGCPWALIQEPTDKTVTCGETSFDWTLRNAQGDELSFSGLMPHLIRDHHFFEGNTGYRVDPVRAIEVLGIEPGVDYAPRYAEEAIWKQTHTSNIGVEDWKDFERFRWPDFLTTETTAYGDVRISIIGDEGIITSASRSIASITNTPLSMPAELSVGDKLQISRPLTLPGGTLHPIQRWPSQNRWVIPIKQVTDRYVEE